MPEIDRWEAEREYIRRACQALIRYVDEVGSVRVTSERSARRLMLRFSLDDADVYADFMEEARRNPDADHEVDGGT